MQRRPSIGALDATVRVVSRYTRPSEPFSFHSRYQTKQNQTHLKSIEAKKTTPYTPLTERPSTMQSSNKTKRVCALGFLAKDGSGRGSGVDGPGWWSGSGVVGLGRSGVRRSVCIVFAPMLNIIRKCHPAMLNIYMFIIAKLLLFHCFKTFNPS
jgi:hypothetical protein